METSLTQQQTNNKINDNKINDIKDYKKKLSYYASGAVRESNILFETYLQSNITDPNIVDSDGNNMLHILAKRKKYSYEIFTTVLNTGVNIDHMNNKSESILECFVDADKQDCTEKIILDILGKTTFVAHRVFLEMLAKKYYNAVAFIAKSETIMRNCTKIGVSIIIKKLVDEIPSIICMNCDNIDNYKKFNLYHETLTSFAKVYDFNENIYDTNFTIYEYIVNVVNKFMTETDCANIALIISSLMLLPNSVMTKCTKSMCEFYVGIGTRYMIAKHGDISYAQQVIMRNMTVNNDFLYMPYSHGTKSPLMIGLENKDFNFVEKCLTEILSNLDKIKSNKINILNVFDKNLNNMYHYMFYACVSHNNPIYIDFLKKSAVDKDLNYLLYKKNANGYIPFNICCYKNYFPFGSKFMKISCFTSSYKHVHTESLLHSFIRSTWDNYIGYTVNYQYRCIDGKPCVEKIVTEYKYKSYIILAENGGLRNIDIKKLTSSNCVNTYITKRILPFLNEGKNACIKPYLYENDTVLNPWSKAENVSEYEKVKLLELFYNEQPSYIEYKDMYGITCYLASVMVNSLLFVNMFIKIGANLLTIDNENNNAFHCIAFNGNEQMFMNITSKVLQLPNGIDLLRNYFLMVNSKNKTPFDICIEEENYNIMIFMLDMYESIDYKFADHLVKKICFNPVPCENHMDVLKKIETLSEYRIFSAELYDDSNQYVCNLVHYCGYNKFYKLLSHMINSCVEICHRELLHVTDNTNKTIIGIAIARNDINIVKILGNNMIRASIVDYGLIHENAGSSYMTPLYELLINYGVVDISVKVDNLTILHKACCHGNIRLVEIILKKNECIGKRMSIE